MREGFHNDLNWISERVEESLAAVRDALELTIESIVGHDQALADVVIGGDDAIDRLCQTIQTEMLGIVARQAPVAGDLRLLTGMGFMAVHIERMGDGCVNVAKLTKLAGPVAYRPEIQSLIATMGAALLRMIDQATRAFLDRDVKMSRDLVRKDDVIDDANLSIFADAVRPDMPPEARTWAAYMMLAGRSLERIGDHIVDLGEQIAFIVTGEFEEFTDASHPTREAATNGV